MEENKIIEEINNDRCYTVYMHTSPSGKRYIGITSKNPPEKRWLNGRGYRNEYFKNAISLYGWDNFKHEILYTGLTKNEAEQKEIELISCYKSNQREYGYNIQSGGKCVGCVSEETKEKLREKNTGKHHTEETKKKIGEVHKGKHISDEHIEVIKEFHNVPVCQYDVNGVFIKKYNSIGDAELETGTSRTSIGNCCHKRIKIANGFIWRRAEEILTKEDIEWCNENINKSVTQYSLSGDFIKKYDAINIAAKELNIDETGISRCCKDNQRIAGGYLWRYEEEALTEEHIKWCNSSHNKKMVIQYTTEGMQINVYDSVTVAQKVTGISNIAMCCRHERSKAGGFIWRYVDDESDEFRKAI